MSFMGRVTYAPGGSNFFTYDPYQNTVGSAVVSIVTGAYVLGGSSNGWQAQASSNLPIVYYPSDRAIENGPELAPCRYCNQWTPKKAHCQHCGAPYIPKDKLNLTYSEGVRATWTDVPDTARSIPLTKGYDPEVLRRYNAEKRRGFLEKVIDLFK